MTSTFVNYLELTRTFYENTKQEIDRQLFEVTHMEPYVEVSNSLLGNIILHYKTSSAFPVEISIGIADVEIPHKKHFQECTLTVRILLPNDLQGDSKSSAESEKSIEEFVNTLFEKMGLGWKYQDFSKNRIGYTTDFVFDSFDIAKKYLSLIRSNYNFDLDQSRGPLKASLYFDIGRTNIYVLTDKLPNAKDDSSDTKKEIKGILRFEIICNSITVDNIIDLFESTGLNYADQEVCVAVAKEAIKELCCSGDYYTYDDAEARIKSSNLDQDSKDLMLWIIDAMDNEAEDLYHTKNRLLRKGYSLTQLEKAISNFNEINVNPVIIPDGWKDKEIPNLLKFL